MAPKASEAERAAKLQRRSLELHNQHLRGVLHKLTKEFPDVLPKIRDYLVLINKWPDSSTAASSATGSVVSSAGGNDAGGDPQNSSFEGTPPSGDKRLNKNFTKLRNMPIVHLQRWLTSLEGISFSAAQLTSLMKRGARECNRERLNEIFEYILNIDPDQPLFEQGRDEESMNQWYEGMKNMYMDLGRRGRELPLPSDWTLSGFYQIHAGDNSYFLTCNRWPGARYPIPLSVTIGVEHVGDVAVKRNFSELRATVQGLSPMNAMRCQQVIELSAQRALPAPPKKRQRKQQLALQDAAMVPGICDEADVAAGSSSLDPTNPVTPPQKPSMGKATPKDKALASDDVGEGAPAEPSHTGAASSSTSAAHRKRDESDDDDDDDEQTFVPP